MKAKMVTELKLVLELAQSGLKALNDSRKIPCGLLSPMVKVSHSKPLKKGVGVCYFSKDENDYFVSKLCFIDDIFLEGVQLTELQSDAMQTIKYEDLYTYGCYIFAFPDNYQQHPQEVYEREVNWALSSADMNSASDRARLLKLSDLMSSSDSTLVKKLPVIIQPKNKLKKSHH